MLPRLASPGKGRIYCGARMTTPELQPSSNLPPARPPGLALVVTGILVAFLVIAAVAGLIVRSSGQESARLAGELQALQKQVESLVRQVSGLRADSERSVALSLADGGYFPVRTNGGTLLVAVANVEEVDSGLRVSLRVGNPHSMTYLGFTLAFAWDKGKGQQTFRDALEPGAWVVVSVMLAPADRASTKTVTITSASVDEIPAR